MTIEKPSDEQRALMTEFLNDLTAVTFQFGLIHVKNQPGDVAAAIISGLACMLADFVRTAPFEQEYKDRIMTDTLHVIKMRFEHGQNLPNT